MSTLGDGIRLKSATFRDGVRLPGSSQSAHYIPSEDYPLTYYPQVHLIEARLRDQVSPMPGYTRKAWYHASAARDMTVDESSLDAPTKVTSTSAGVLVSPMARMKQGPGGSFERITDEEAAAGPVVEAPMPSPDDTAQQSPAANRGGWPKGKPRGKAKAAPADAEHARPAAMATVPHPGPRVHGGQKGD